MKEKTDLHQQPDNQRLIQLQSAVEEFIVWLKANRPYVSGLGAPISMLTSAVIESKGIGED